MPCTLPLSRKRVKYCRSCPSPVPLLLQSATRGATQGETSMRSWPMLFQRGSTWYYRRSVPLALRPLLDGKREVWKSLRTSDVEKAKLLSLRVGQEVERNLQAHRRRAATLQTDPET